MGTGPGVSLFVLLGVLLALAGPVAGGGMKTTFAAGGPGPWPGDAEAAAAALRRLMSSSSSRLEDGVAPELPVDLELHRRILAGGGHVSAGALEASKAYCNPNCPAPGEPYTGRGCEKKYQCKN
ncbi:hypothetical protein ACP4OV_029114 [Aristida adscensionis]